MILARIDPAEVSAARAKIPSLQHGRRFETIEPMAEPVASARRARPGMIRYALACDKGHSFESWFQNSAAYDKQAKQGLVTCPICDSAKVEKAIMAPRVSSARKRGAERAPRRDHRSDPGGTPG